MSDVPSGSEIPRPATAGGRYWVVVVAAAAILMVTMGIRQSMGLFVSPLNSATGLGLVSISFALAVGQLMWGACQPVLGAIADRWGPGRVLVVGGVMLAVGSALTPWATTEWTLVFTAGVLSAIGAGAGSFSVLIGATAWRLPPERRAVASGFINAGGSLGQFVFAPLNQALISAFGWISAMYAMAASALLTLPLAALLKGRQGSGTVSSGTAPVGGGQTAGAVREIGLRQQLRLSARDPSYWCLHAGFFTCGFHIAFLVTHLPGEVGLCGQPAQVAATALALIGLANIAGSLCAGALCSRMPMKMVLFWTYFARAMAVGLYLLAPKTPWTFYLFAAVLGFTWLSTVPPTAGLVGKLFGPRYLATLFGLTLFSHQIGGFFGAWLGGLALVELGSYQWMWYADMALALAAAMVNLPIREPRAWMPA